MGKLVYVSVLHLVKIGRPTLSHQGGRTDPSDERQPYREGETEVLWTCQQEREKSVPTTPEPPTVNH